MTACGHAWRLWDRLGRLHLLAALVLGRFLDNAAVWAAKDMPEGAQALGTEQPLGTAAMSNLASGVSDPGVLTAFAKSFIMILATELGDETFIIAAIMAMRHSRRVVYAGAISALVFMTVISTALGYVLPNLISREATHHAATVLYTIFGVRLLWIAWRSKPQESNQEEMEEVQQKLADAEQSQREQHSHVHAVLAGICSAVFLEACILTFIAEWGDRSQIATITLAAVYNPVGVTVGAILGHCVCTGTAVLGGKLLAMRISQRTVALSGGTLFLAFAAHNALHRQRWH